jgi:2-methylisocitrate lyase-like PEP mutase family enzyme
MSPHENRVDAFHRLHAAGCFVMPNPWDVGSARVLEQLGFEALATTSAGLAWSLGRGDAQVTLDEVLEHLTLVAAAVTVPVNADFRDGYAVEPEGVATNVTMAVDTGIAGLSIEDSSGNDADPLLDFALSVRRMEAARRAIDQRASSTGVPTSTRPSAGCRRTQRLARTACTHPASTTWSRCRRSWPRCRRSR